jgi:hypothetical protein
MLQIALGNHKIIGNNSEIESLEPRQIQMLKRNITVYRRANQRLKEIKR